MVPDNVNIKCGWCRAESKLINWDKGSYEACTNRKMKRDFCHLTNERAYRRQDCYYYKCPVCGKWMRGSQVSITGTEDKRLLALGGEDVIKIEAE